MKRLILKKKILEFFEQWLYKHGALNIAGDWTYNGQKQEVKINLNQVQLNENLIKIPLLIAILYGDGKTQMEILNVDKKSNEFLLKVSSESKKLILDPEYWVLMDLDFKKKLKLGLKGIYYLLG
ncbi:hypothetical protein [Algoriphagus marinus]|uniref:hypothetical protein n=1 Tax=Algoriphagus marinus TaxID=1925762 RepID=UPI00094B8DED|nr:hypothetical protein [Algoriphagus marinus]